MFESLPKLPPSRRWRGQSFPGPVVVALIQRKTAVGRPAFLLIRRNGDTYTGQWALIGGKWDFGETLITAVTREVKEETGLDTDFVALRGLVNELLAPPDQDSVGAHFLIFVCELSAPNGRATEQDEGAVAWFTLPQIDQLQQRGEIIPSDYAMIREFAGNDGKIPHFEAQMVALIGTEDEHPARLLSFERIGAPTPPK